MAAAAAKVDFFFKAFRKALKEGRKKDHFPREFKCAIHPRI